MRFKWYYNEETKTRFKQFQLCKNHKSLEEIIIDTNKLYKYKEIQEIFNRLINM